MNSLVITPTFTPRDSVAFKIYLSEIERLPLISPTQETELCIRIANGDEHAVSELVQANLRFAISVAKKYQGLGLPMSDLVAEANIGLIKAARRFDRTRGFKFISYAVWWIRQSILEAVSTKGRNIRIPGNQIAMMRKVKIATEQLEQQLERQPTAHEIAAHLDVTVESVRRTQAIDQKVSSLDKQVNDESLGGATLIEFLSNVDVPPPTASLEREDLLKEIAGALNALPARQADVLSWTFGLDSSQPLTFEEVGNRMNLSKERVRQLQQRALQTLRTEVPLASLRVYLN